MFCVGLSSSMRHANGYDWRYIHTRFALMASLSLGITVVTYIFNKPRFIYFGALHCITLNSVLHLPFLLNKLSSGIAGILILSYTPFFGVFPLELPIYPTMDFIPWFNNLGYVLLGVAAHKFSIHQIRFPLFTESYFTFIGQNALKIYLIHMTIIFTLFLLIK